jgi:hypothetical protein
LNACNKKQIEDKTFPLKITKEIENNIDILAKEQPLFARIADNDHIYPYILQNQDNNCEVLKMTHDLEIKETYIIKRGAGPGEAMNPRIYGGDGQSILVYDLAGFKYIELDGSFNLIDEYRLNNLGVPLYSGAWYVPKQRLVLDGFSSYIDFYKGADQIYILNITNGKDKGIKTSKIYDTSKKLHTGNKKRIVGNPVHFGYFFDHIYVLDKREYRIIKMDIAGEVMRKKKIPFEPRTFSPGNRETWVEQFDGKEWVERFDYPEELWPACWMIPIHGGIAVGRCLTYDPNEKGPITADYFDPDLNGLGKITLPYFEAWNHPAHGQVRADMFVLYKNNKLYISEDQEGESRITRWEVRVEKN